MALVLTTSQNAVARLTTPRTVSQAISIALTYRTGSVIGDERRTIFSLSREADFLRGFGIINSAGGACRIMTTNPSDGFSGTFGSMVPNTTYRIVVTKASGLNGAITAYLDTIGVTASAGVTLVDEGFTKIHVGGRAGAGNAASEKVGGKVVRLAVFDDVLSSADIQVCLDASKVPTECSVQPIDYWNAVSSVNASIGSNALVLVGSPTFDADTLMVPNVATVTDPIVPGVPFSFTATNFTNGTFTGITTGLPGLTVSSITGTSTSGGATLSGWVDDTVCDELPKAVTLTFNDGVSTDTIASNIAVPAGYTKLVLDAPTLVAGSIAGDILSATGRTLVTGDVLYFIPYGNLVVSPTGSYTVSTSGTITAWVRIAAGADAGKMFSYGINVIAIPDFTLRNGASINVATLGLPTANAVTIATQTVAGMTGSGNLYNVPNPTLAPGATVPKYGESALTISDGTVTENFTVNVLPAVTQTFVTLTSVGNGAGYIDDYLACAIGDQIVFDLPATLSVVANNVSASGGISTDYMGTQTMWHRNGATGVVTQISVITPDVAATQYTFTDSTNQALSTLVESNVVTIAGVTAATDIPISVTGGEYAINTGSGFGAFTAVAGVIQLGHTVKVRGTSSGTANTSVNVVLNVGGVVDTFTITTAVSVSPAIVSVNAGTVRADSTGNTLVTTNLSAATGLTLGGVAATAFAGSNNSYTFTAPVLSAGNTVPAFGTVTAVATDGTSSPSTSVSFQPRVTQGYVTLTSSVNAAGYVGFYVACAVGDQIVFDLPAALGVTANGVDVDGRIFTDYSGTQTFWHRNGTTGVLTELSVLTPAVNTDTVPTQFTFTDQTGAEFGTVTTSNTITVAGIDTTSPISITGGTYSKNGGAYTSTAGTVVNGDTVAVRVTSSAVALTAVTTTLDIGTVTDVFSVTTRAYDTVPTGFTLTAVSGATISTQYTSNSITVAGVDAGINVPISITGGEYAINTGSGFGAFTAVAGNVQLGHQVQVRVTSSGNGDTTVSATLNIGTTTGVYSVGTGALDLTPDSFSFTSAPALELSALTESNVVTVAGITPGVDVAITITNGEYAINNGGGFGAFTSVGGVIRNGYTVKVRSTASALYATGKVVTLTMGSVSGTFTLTTRVADTTPAPFNFTAQTNASPSAVATSNTITVSGVDAAVPINISVANGLYNVNGGAYTSTAGTVVLGDVVTARTTASASFNTAVTTTVTIGGVPDVFSVTTRVADTIPTAQNFTTVNNGEPYTWGTSDDTVVSGVDNGVNIAIAITGGEYAINSGGGFGAFTTAAGVIQGGWGLRVRTAVNNTFGGSASCTVTIGTTQSTFTVNTRAADVTPNSVSFTAVTGAALNTVTTSNSVVVSGVDDDVDISISIVDGMYNVNGAPYTASAGNVRRNDVITVRRNSSASNSTAVSTTLTLGGVDATFIITTAAPADVTPDAFTFTDATNAGLSASVVSNVFAVQGTTPGVDVPISITGGEYAIDPDTGVWGAYTTNAGVVRYNQQVRVRGTASSSPSTTTNVLLNIGGITDTFSITTRVADTTPTPFTFTDQTGAAVSTVVTSNAITVAGTDAGIPVNISVTGGEYNINGGAFTATAGTVVLGDVVRTRLTTSALEATAAISTVTIGGQSDIFSVTTILSVDDQPTAPVIVLGTTIFESEEFVIEDVTPGVPVSISVDDCEYAVDDGSGFGAYTDLDGVVYLNDIVKVRMAMMGSTVTGSTGTVMLGDGTYTYVVTVSGTAPIDTTPDSFVITPVANATISTLVESQPFTITGVDAGEDVSVTVTDLEWAFSRNGVWSAYRTTAGNVRLSDEVRVRIMASGTLNGVVSGVINVGGVPGTFTVTATTATDITPDVFSFAAASELEPSEEVSSTVVTVSGITTSAVINCNVTNGFYSVNSGTGWGPWISTQSTVRLGYRIRLKGRANRLKGGTTTVGLSIGTVSSNWVLRTTSKTISSSSSTTKYSSFTYPLQPASGVVRDRILTLTETLVPGTVTATVRRKAIWNDVLDLVRYTDYTLSSMPAIDFTGFAYRNLPSLLLAVNSAGGSSSFRADYHAAMEYIVRECWQELTLLMSSQADCTVNGVVIRSGLITLQCITKS